jgi:hypothetical protein
MVIGGAVVAVVVLLVLLGPTIASMGLIASIAQDKASAQIHGKVKIDSVSIGWISGLAVSGAKVYDDQGQLVLTIDQLKTPISIFGALGSSYDLGNTTGTITLNRFDCYEDGSTTLDHLLNGEAQPKHHAAGTPPGAGGNASGKSGGGALPNVKGNIVLNLSGNIYQEGVPNPLVLAPGTQASISIPDINGPISNDIELQIANPQGKPGTVSIKGDATAVQNNKLDLDALKVHQTLTLTDLALPTLMPVVKAAVPTLDYELPAGVQSGTLTLTADGQTNVQIAGNLRTDQAEISGGALREGDVLRFDDMVVPIKANIAPAADGKPSIDAQIDVLLDDGNTGKISISANGAPNTMSQAANLIPAAVQTLIPAAKGAPQVAETASVQGEGNIKVSAFLDMALLAPMLKNTLALRADIRQGKLTSDSSVAIKDNTATLQSSSQIELAGTQNGKDVQIHPIDVSFSASVVGGSPPQITDPNIKMSSAFLQAAVVGHSLGALDATGNADLAAMNNEIGQFVDLDTILNGPAAESPGTPEVEPPPVPLTLAGQFNFHANTRGDFNVPGSDVPVTATLTGSNIAVQGLGGAPPTNLQQLAADFSTSLHRGGASEPFFTEAKNLTLNVHAGSSGAAPELSLNATADLKLPSLAAPTWQTQLSIPDLNRFQQECGGLIPTLAKMGIELQSGAVAAQASGSYDGQTLALAQPATLQISQLSVIKHDAGGGSASLLSNETITGTAQGSFALGGALGAEFDQLSLTSSSGLISLQKAAGSPFALGVDAKAGMSGGGQLELTADAKRLIDLYDGYSGALPGPQDPRIDRGNVDLTLDVKQTPGTGTTISTNGKLTDLTVTRNGAAVVSDQTMNLAGNLTAAPGNAKLTGGLSIAGALANISVDQLDVMLTDPATNKPVGVLDMLRSAHVAASTPDVGKAWTLLEAAQPKTAAPPAAPPAAAPAPSPAAGASAAPAAPEISPAPGPLPEQYASAGRIDPPDDNSTPTPAPPPRKHKKHKPTTAPSAQTPAQASAPAGPLPPLDMQGGVGTLDLSIQRDVPSHTTTLSGNAHLAQVTFSRGQKQFSFDPGKEISLNFAATVDAQDVGPTTAPAAGSEWNADAGPTTAPTSAPAEEESAQESVGELGGGIQVNSIKITTLDGDLGGLATLSMPSPLSVSNPLSAPSASGKVQIDGSLAPLSPLAAVVIGQSLPATGTFDVHEELSNVSDSIKALGGVDLTALSILQNGKAAASESTVTIGNDLAVNLKRDDLTLADLSVVFAQSQALSVKAKGTISDWSIHRDLDLTADVGYDLAKLMPLVQPFLSASVQAQLQGGTIAGQHQSQFVLGGSYPAEDHLHRPLTFQKSIKNVQLNGDLAVGTLNLPVLGADISNLTVPLTLRDGIAKLTYPDNAPQTMPAPAAFNEGTLDLGGMSVDLTAAQPRFTSLQNKQVVSSAKLNPVLMQVCGKLVGSLFATAQQARGYLDVTIDHADGVALGDQLYGKHSGSAKVIFSVRNLDMNNPIGAQMAGKVLGQLAPALSSVLGGSSDTSGQDTSQADTFQGDIQNATVVLAAGVVTSDVTLNLQPSSAAQANGGQAGGQGNQNSNPGDFDNSSPQPAAGGQNGQGAQAPPPMPFKFNGTVRLSDQTQHLNMSLPPQFFGRMFSGKSKVEDTLVAAFPDGIPIVMAGTTSNPTIQTGDIGKQILKSQTNQLMNGGSGGLQNQLQQLLGGSKKKKNQSNGNSGDNNGF